MELLVHAHTIEIKKTPVNEKEINITKCKFVFDDEITDEYVKEAYFTLNGESYKQIIVNNECDIPSEVLVEKGTLEIGVVATLIENEQYVKRYNPRPVYFGTWQGSLRDAENSQPITPSEFEQYEQALQDGLSEVNQKIEDIDEALENVDEAITETNNLDLDVDKQGKVATVTLTKKDASTKVVTLSDGTSLMFNWDGTKLGIKTDDDQDYTYVDLQGVQGPIGPKGEAFTIKKTYSSVAEMNADFNNMQLGDYVMIASTVEVEDNAKLYTRGESQWIFISDFSGATGIRGETGLTPNIQIGTVVSGETPSVTRTGTNENPILNFTLVKGDTGATGPTGQTGPTGNGIASITKTATVGLVDTYTITYTNGTTTTFDVTNGEDGDVSPTEFNALKVRVEDLEENQIIDEVEGTSINITDAHDTRVYDFELTKESSQAETPSPSNPQEVITVKGYENLIGLGTQLNGFVNSTLQFKVANYSVGYLFETNVLPDVITFNAVGGNRANVNYFNEVPHLNTIATLQSSSSTLPRTITVNKNYPYVHIQFSYDKLDVTNIQVVKGTTTKPYVPSGNNYVVATISDGSNTNNVAIPLNGNEIAGIGEYLDELIVDKSGHVYLNKKNNKYIIDGTETWSIQNNVFVTSTLQDIKPTPAYADRNQKLIISNYYMWQLSNYRQNVQNNHICKVIDGNYYRQIAINDERYTTADDFKDWLSSHNTVVYYVRETPQLIDLNTTIDLRLFKGTNIITNSEGATMKVRYVVSIDSLVQRVAALEQANQ